MGSKFKTKLAKPCIACLIKHPAPKPKYKTGFGIKIELRLQTNKKIIS